MIENHMHSIEPWHMSDLWVWRSFQYYWYFVSAADGQYVSSS